MYSKKWSSLKKINDTYELEPEKSSSKTQCPSRINFTQLAFDWEEERLIAVDSAGYIYHIDLSYSSPSYQRLGNIGQATFVAYNPIDKSEVLVGLTNGDIKILKVNVNVSQFCLLIAHKIPPTHVSFYKNYCLTCSRKEVIIWCLRSCSKAHQLRVNTKNVVVKKASFSSLGHVVVLYHNDTIQAWMFSQFETDNKIDAKTFGIRNIKDFVFTRNGRAMILAGTQNKIIILNTCSWNLLNTLTLPENFIGVKQLSVVPLELDGGANKILACVSSSCTLHFLDLSSSRFIDILQSIKTVKKMVVSPNGRYIAYIEQEGNLKLIIAEKLLSEKCKQSQKLKEPSRLPAHRISDHLQCVKHIVKQELHLERLLPILKEFGEYPEKYRVLIWSTILNLPANRCAYSALANKATCAELTSELLKNYPLANKSKRALLMSTMNCLIQWCPLLVQSIFLPNLVFPFLMVFQKDLLLGFELILIILTNYCQKWFEYHPLPPLNVLGIIENILLEADPSLLNILCERGITSSEYAWPLLKSAMSEVLSGSEWLILWDHLISFQKPSLLIMCVVAYSICSREIIISLLHSPESVKRFYSTQGHIRAKDLLKVAHQLDNDTPLRVHPSRYLRDELMMLPSKGPYPPFMLQDFPKFLTDDLTVSELEKVKERERTMSERSRKAMKIAEEKRLHHERKAFMDQIHQARLNEVQKCIQEQSYNTDWELKKWIQKPGAELDISIHSDEDIMDSKDKVKDYKQLQKDVDVLEYEVQSLLDSFKSQRSREDIT